MSCASCPISANPGFIGSSILFSTRVHLCFA
jgi:hypothetical protein